MVQRLAAVTGKKPDAIREVIDRVGDGHLRQFNAAVGPLTDGFHEWTVERFSGDYKKGLAQLKVSGNSTGLQALLMVFAKERPWT